MSLWSRQSIAVKLPVTLVLLLLAAFGAMAIASYFEMRKAVVAIAGERLEQAARQMAGVLGSSSRQRLVLMQTLMSNPEVRGYLARAGSVARGGRRRSMRTYLGNAAEIGNVELWDPAGRRLLAVGATFAEATGPALELLKAELQAAGDARDREAAARRQRRRGVCRRRPDHRRRFRARLHRRAPPAGECRADPADDGPAGRLDRRTGVDRDRQ